jgi:hypothetical protein
MSATGTRRAKREYCLRRAAAYDRFARKYPSKAEYGQVGTENGQMNGVLTQGAINDCLRICSCEHGGTDPLPS